MLNPPPHRFAVTLQTAAHSLAVPGRPRGGPWRAPSALGDMRDLRAAASSRHPALLHKR